MQLLVPVLLLILCKHEVAAAVFAVDRVIRVDIVRPAVIELLFRLIGKQRPPGIDAGIARPMNALPVRMGIVGLAGHDLVDENFVRRKPRHRNSVTSKTLLATGSHSLTTDGTGRPEADQVLSQRVPSCLRGYPTFPATHFVTTFSFNCSMNASRE